jgi:acetylglutamate kinase
VTAAPIIVKIGGRALEAPDAPRELAHALQRLDRRVVLVHGGGAEVTAWCDRLGIAAHFEDGLRVTDPATLDVVAAVLAGLANKRLVATLRDAGFDAVGLSALDGGTAMLEPHADARRLGAVGQVRRGDPSLVLALLARGSVPVLASVGDHAGGLLNLNADDFAAALAAALGAEELVLLSDTAGLVLDGAVVPRLDTAGIAAALARPDVTGGMRPKLEAARTALARGVARVWVASWSGPDTLSGLLANEGTGTRFEPDAIHASLPTTHSTEEALP